MKIFPVLRRFFGTKLSSSLVIFVLENWQLKAYNSLQVVPFCPQKWVRITESSGFARVTLDFHRFGVYWMMMSMWFNLVVWYNGITYLQKPFDWNGSKELSGTSNWFENHHGVSLILATFYDAIGEFCLTRNLPKNMGNMAW